MSEPLNPAVEAAIQRGDRTAAVLIKNRDQLFEPLREILLVAGPAGLRACAAGVVEAVIAQHEARAGSALPGEIILPFGAKVGDAS